MLDSAARTEHVPQLTSALLSYAVQAADQGIGGQAWDYRDMRSQQLLSRLIERMRALPQPIVCAVQVRSGGWVAGAAGWLVRLLVRAFGTMPATLPPTSRPLCPSPLCPSHSAGRGGRGRLCARNGQRRAHRQPRCQVLGRVCALGPHGCEQLPLREDTGCCLCHAKRLRLARRHFLRCPPAPGALLNAGTDMGTSYFLWRLAGLGIASELLLTGRMLPAERAYQVGMGRMGECHPCSRAVLALLRPLGA